jgi:hypothetical protein
MSLLSRRSADLQITAQSQDRTVLTVRRQDDPSDDTAQLFAGRLAGLCPTGVQHVDTVDDQITISFDPSALTRSHVELLIRTANHQA